MKGKLLKTLRQFLIITLVFVMLLPSFANAATAVVQNTGFSVVDAVNNALLDLGIMTPHQNSFTAWVEYGKNVDTSIANYKTYYQAGDVLKMDIKFLGTINDISDDTKLVFKFGDTGVERVLTKEDAVLLNNDCIEFSYTLQGPSYDENGNIIDRGDNGGLEFCYILGEVSFDESEVTTVFALPSDLNVYKNKIIADTVSAEVKMVDGEVEFNERIFNYVPGEVTSEFEEKEVTDPESGETTKELVEKITDNRENGTIRRIKSSDVKLISDNYNVVKSTEEDIDEVCFILKGGKLEILSGTKYIPVKVDGKVLCYKASNNKYYIKVASKENQTYQMVSITDLISPDAFTGNGSLNDNIETIEMNTSKIVKNMNSNKSAFDSIMKSLVSLNEDEEVSINDMVIKAEEGEAKNTANFLFKGLKEILGYTGNVANETANLTYSVNQIFYEATDGTTGKSNLYSTSNVYFKYLNVEKKVAFYYNICNGKYYISVSKDENVNFVDISSFINTTFAEENELNQKCPRIAILDRAEHTVEFNLTELVLNDEFMKNFEIDVKTLKTQNGVELVGLKSEKEGDVTTYTWKVFINEKEYSLVDSNKNKIGKQYVVNNLKNYLNSLDAEIVKGETRILQLNDDQIVFYEKNKENIAIFFDKTKEVELDGKNGSFVAYYNTKVSPTQAILYSQKDENNKVNYYYYNEFENITNYIKYDSENNMYLDLGEFTPAGGSLDLSNGKKIFYTAITRMIINTDNIEMLPGDEICIPNAVDIAGNILIFHYRFDDGILTKLYEENSENAISPVIILNTDGVGYTDKESGRTIFFNKKGSKYTIETLAHYKDGSVQIGFLNINDPDNTDKEPAEYKNAKYVSYNEATGMTKWEYEIKEGDQGELFIRIDNCGCYTDMFTKEVKEGDEVVEEAKDFRLVEFNKYFADSIAPKVETLQIYEYFLNDDYYERVNSLSNVDVYTNVNHIVNPITGEEDVPDLTFEMYISDETKMDRSLASSSYTSEEEAHFNYTDYYDRDNCLWDYEKNVPVEYNVNSIYEYVESLSEKYDMFADRISDKVYRETDTNLVILKEDLGNYSKGTKEYDYVNGEWDVSETTAVTYKVGEYIDYIVDAKALVEGIAKPVVNVKDYAGNEASYMINRNENEDCYYLVLVDTTEPEYEVTRLVERTNEKTFECDVKYTDPEIDGYLGSGVGSISLPEITNGKIIDAKANFDVVTYTIMPENDGYTKLYFYDGICADKVNNTNTRKDLRSVYIDTTGPVIDDVTGVPDTKVKEAKISVIAHDLSNFKYAFQMIKSGETFDKEKFEYTDDNTFNLTCNGTLYIGLKDELGNETLKAIEITKIDGTVIATKAPIVKTNTLSNYYTIPTDEDKASITLELEADADNACELYYCTSDKLTTDFNELEFTKAGGYNKYSQQVKLPEGKWYIYVYAVDTVTGVNSACYFSKTPIEVNKSEITFVPSSTEVTEDSIVVAVNYGKGLTENRLAGFENSREINLTSVVVSENGEVYAEATDKAGNKVYATYKVENIRKVTKEDVKDEEQPIVLFNTNSENSKVVKVIVSDEKNGTNYVVIQPNTTLDELVENDDIVSTGSIKVMTDDKKAEVKSDINLSTGKVMKFSDLDDEYVIIVKGDVNGDGEVSMLDIIKMNKARLNKVTLTDAQKEAADVNGDNTVTMLDIIRANKYRLRKINEF